MIDNKFSKKSVPLILSDTTLRDGLRASHFSPSLSEKEMLFSALVRSCIPIIEVGYVIHGTQDLELLGALDPIASRESSLALLCHANAADIKTAAAALKPFPKPRLNLYLNVGKLQLSYQEPMATKALARHAMDMVALAATLCDDVQLTLMDATRCPLDDLITIAKSALKYGLGTLCISDTMGCATPMSMSQLINRLSAVVDLESVHLGVHCHNDNHLANEIALIAHQCGVAIIEGTIAGIGERKGGVNLVEIMRRHHLKSEALELIESDYLKLIEAADANS